MGAAEAGGLCGSGYRPIIRDSMKDRHLYFTREQWQDLAGPDWPDYDAWLQGASAPDPIVQHEIDDFEQKFRRDGAVWPIRTATACQSKWSWSTIYLNQLSTASCHRVNPTPFDLDQFDQFHNVPKKIHDRELMLRGEWPTGGCEYCRDIEDVGGFSDRMHNTAMRGLVPQELLSDPRSLSVTPTIVEIFAQNTCNLACVYCNSHVSSRIEQENQRFGAFVSNGVTITPTQVPAAAPEYFQRFMTWLDNNIQHLRRLHLLGGETFIQHDLMNSVLSVIERRANPNLSVCVFSNFNVPDRYWFDYLARFRDLQARGHIQRMELTASIDCWGAAAEYVRSGLNLDRFETKFAWAVEQDPAWLGLNVNQTITAMTIRTMPDLIDKLRYYSQNRHIGHYWEFYCGPQQFQHPRIFSGNFWRRDFERIFAAMPRDTEQQLEAIPRMQGIWNLLQAVTTPDTHGISQLHTYLDELDRRRGTDWRSIFPYLDLEAT